MFDIRQSPWDEGGDRDEAREEQYIDGLTEAFAESPEGQAHAERYDSLGWVHSYLHFAVAYVGTAPPEMTRRGHNEVLYDLFPRKVTTEPESAEEIVAEVRAFWQFLKRQYQLPQADGLIAELNDDAVAELKDGLGDPSNFGMAKSFVAMGQQAGFDMTTEQGTREFKALYNASLIAGRGGAGRSAKAAASRPGRLTRAERKARKKARLKRLGKRRRS